MRWMTFQDVQSFILYQMDFVVLVSLDFFVRKLLFLRVSLIIRIFIWYTIMSMHI